MFEIHLDNDLVHRLGLSEKVILMKQTSKTGCETGQSQHDQAQPLFHYVCLCRLSWGGGGRLGILADCLKHSGPSMPCSATLVLMGLDSEWPWIPSALCRGDF